MLRVAMVLLVGLAALSRLAAQEAPKHVPMLDTGGHMAMVTASTFTPDGRQLVSAAYDKTIRVWDLTSGASVRTIRGEIAPGNFGKVYALALSRDGRWLAAGGRFKSADNEIRLYDFSSGTLAALLKGHGDLVFKLTFSPDGRYLLSGSADGTAILWDVDTRQPEHRLAGHREAVTAVGFTPDGARAVTGSLDHELRIWRVRDGAEIARMIGHGEQVNALAVGRDGTIASGDFRGEIRLWDGWTGQFLKTLARQDNMVGSLSFGPDGTKLLSTTGTGGRDCHVYDIASGREIVTYRSHDNSVFSSAISPDGRWAATAGGNNQEIHVWDFATGERHPGSDGKPLTLGGQGRPVWAVGVSADGRRIGWGQSFGYRAHNDRGPLQYSLTLPSAVDALPRPEPLTEASASGFRRAAASWGGWLLRDRVGGKDGHVRPAGALDIVRDDQVVATIERGITNGFRHSAYSFTADGEIIISGSASGTITAYDRTGRPLGELLGHEGDIWAVTASSDGRFVVSGAHDQTLRLWNLTTRELLVTVFHGADGEWVMWTPEGFFISSENGGKLVGWHINQGPGKEARFVTAEQVRKLFNRPDLIAAKLEGGPENIRKVREEAERLDIDAILESGPAPEVAIVSPGDGWEANDNAVTVTVRVIDKGGGIGRIAFRVNGQARNGEDDSGGGPAFGAMALNERGELTRRFQLARTDNVIEATATNGANFVESLPARLTVKADERTLKGVPDLYVLAAGVDDYFDSALTLKYAVRDADAIGAAIEAAAKSKAGVEFYRNVVVRRLRNGEVTREKLDAAFTEIGRQARATDVFVLFIAGHGKSEGNVYYFLPPDFKHVGLNPLQAQGISTDVWESWTARIQADKSLLIYDTCEAGSLARGRDRVAARGLDEIAAYETLKRSTGRITLSASAAADIALEGYRNKHGILTYAILEAIARGDGDDNRPQLSVFGLIDHVTRRVPEISCEMTPPGAGRQSCYRQVPKASLNDLNNSFPLLPRYAAADPDPRAHVATTGAGAIGMPAPVERTHFLKTPMNLLDAPGGEILRPLPARFGVGKIRVENGFALVARDGKTIGYVPDDGLEELQ